MNINRNNYEEYFLLYADNELTQTEKKVVEIFVQEHVDLKEEFLMVQMTVNTPEEEMKILDKSFLLKTAPAFINKNNYEEIFVLYYDNELSEEQKKETEGFVIENPRFQSEFELTGKAKLVAEKSIIYLNKKELYRKEKSGKIIPLVLWRSLAAAVFIGFGLWITVSYFNKNEVQQPVATTINNTNEKLGIKEPKPDKKIPALKAEDKEEPVVSSTKIKEPRRINGERTKMKQPVSLEEKVKKEFVVKTEIKVKDSSIEEKIKTLKPDVDLATSTRPVKESPEPIEKTGNSLEDNIALVQKKDIEPDIQKPDYVQRASYISPADDNNDNYVFYDVSAEEFRKSKVGGFLKKVKRVVERNNPITRLFPGDEEQIAAK